MGETRIEKLLHWERWKQKNNSHFHLFHLWTGKILTQCHCQYIRASSRIPKIKSGHCYLLLVVEDHRVSESLEITYKQVMYMLPVAVAWVSPSECKVAKRRKHAQVIIHHARARLLLSIILCYHYHSYFPIIPNSDSIFCPLNYFIYYKTTVYISVVESIFHFIRRHCHSVFLHSWARTSRAEFGVTWLGNDWASQVHTHTQFTPPIHVQFRK